MFKNLTHHKTPGYEGPLQRGGEALPGAGDGGDLPRASYPGHLPPQVSILVRLQFIVLIGISDTNFRNY